MKGGRGGREGGLVAKVTWVRTGVQITFTLPSDMKIQGCRQAGLNLFWINIEGYLMLQ